jgi:hypothetical protein
MMERNRKVRTVMNLGMFQQIFNFDLLILSPLFVNNVAVKSAICVYRNPDINTRPPIYV